MTINKKDVKFKARHFNLAGRLFFPENFDESQKNPAIVISHPTSADMNQTSSIYAEELAKKGFLTLVFDASYQGQSEGEPRFLEDPYARTEDVSFAIDYLVSLPYVDQNKVGAMGICAGGGYTINAAKVDHRIKAVAGVVAGSSGGAYRESFGPDEKLIEVLEQMGEQRTAEAQGAEPLLVNYYPTSNEAVKEMGITDVDIVQAVDYYTTPRGQDKYSPNKVRYTSMAYMLGYDPLHMIDKLLTQPLLMIAGGIPGQFGSYRLAYDVYYKSATKADEKELYIVPETTHYELYDQPEAVSKAVNKLSEFFGKYL
ncbi:alpha/beta hydrolase [Floricoccus penangensis]|uniref:alpha/beta hydrolase n=1 Tax=Floricoccus penangensis TaxID=1859475 RepID=UPI00203BF3D0|nr:alpha/beta hydrolase [Floricoccus penangensis]URZ87120.1 alpha/beta hydrolase [Floricoccus penangensis]